MESVTWSHVRYAVLFCSGCLVVLSRHFHLTIEANSQRISMSSGIFSAAAIMKDAVFLDTSPRGSSKKNWRFRRTYRLRFLDKKPRSLVALKAEALCSLETSVLLTRATRRHIPEDNILLIFIQMLLEYRLSFWSILRDGVALTPTSFIKSRERRCEKIRVWVFYKKEIGAAISLRECLDCGTCIAAVVLKYVVQWLKLAVSSGPNKVGVLFLMWWRKYINFQEKYIL
jgi:hypothetical protein